MTIDYTIMRTPRDFRDDKIAGKRRDAPLVDRIANIRAKAMKLGLPNADFDFKTFTDDMWNDEHTDQGQISVSR
jgi:hypothetical protein